MSNKIPGSTLAPPIQWRRIEDAPAGKVYLAQQRSGRLVVIVSRDPAGKDGALLWHVSISHRDSNNVPDRCPTWDEMKSAKYQLVPEDVPMVLIFPRRSAPYVDMYPTALHLWESTEETIDV